jgi:hypothetical protein
MNMKVIFILLLTAPPLALSADEPSREDLQKQIAALRTEIELLKKEATADRLTELERRIDLVAAEVERSRTGGAVDAEAPGAGEPGLGPAASKVYRVPRGVSIGGYGEALYQRFDETNQSGAPSGLVDRLDLNRVVLYTGYKFDDRILFNSEVEYEHASTGEGAEERGEVSVEQAYLEFRPWRNAGVRAGMVVLPLGFLNELHEPPTFFGARRNDVESAIIPTTWHEVGLGVFGETGPLQWRGYVVAGLDSRGFSAEGIEEGRQQGSQSLAENAAFAGRFDYSGVPHTLVGVSAFTGDSGQGAQLDGRPIGGRVTLYDVHARFEHRGFQARLLYAHSSIADVASINAQNGLVGTESVGERQHGFYAEAAFDLMTLKRQSRWSVSPFFRYERLNTQDRVPAGFAPDPRNDRTIWTTGVSVAPVPPVVLKADYQFRHDAAQTGTNQLNLAVGYLF